MRKGIILGFVFALCAIIALGAFYKYDNVYIRKDGSNLTSDFVQQSDIDTEAEVETIVGDISNMLIGTEINSEAKLEGLTGVTNILSGAEVDTEAEVESLIGNADEVFTDNDVLYSDYGLTAGGTIKPYRLVSYSSGNYNQAGNESSTVAWVSSSSTTVSGSTTFEAKRGIANVYAKTDIEGGRFIKSTYDGGATMYVTDDIAGSTLASNSGTAFTNQPANDGVEVKSSDTGDTTQDVTIIGTRNGQGDSVYTEQLSLNGTNVIATSTYSDWEEVLAVKLTATLTGDLTVQEASGNSTITTLTSGTTKGVVTPSDTAACGVKVVWDADGASTKQVGCKYTKASDGTTAYQGDELNGTTDETGATAALSVSEFYVGDVEGGVTAYLKRGAADDEEGIIVGRALADGTAGSTVQADIK